MYYIRQNLAHVSLKVLFDYSHRDKFLKICLLFFNNWFCFGNFHPCTDGIRDSKYKFKFQICSFIINTKFLHFPMPEGKTLCSNASNSPPPRNLMLPTHVWKSSCPHALHAFLITHGSFLSFTKPRVNHGQI